MPIYFKFHEHGIIISWANNYSFTVSGSGVVASGSLVCLFASVACASSAFLLFAFSCCSRISSERETQARLPNMCSTSSV